MITKNFIKMCEKAEEIQKAWEPTNCDYYINKKYPLNLQFIGSDDEQELLIKKDCIWLPMREQLQEMIFGEDVGVQTITSALEQFSKSDIGSSISILGNMKELWLAFVMKEKYNKIWNGKKWRKNK